MLIPFLEGAASTPGIAKAAGARSRAGEVRPNERDHLRAGKRGTKPLRGKGGGHLDVPHCAGHVVGPDNPDRSGPGIGVHVTTYTCDERE